MLKVKVYTNNKNKVEMIACGKSIYKNLLGISAKEYIGHPAITESTRIVEDIYMRPNQFIGLDLNGDWVFSSL